MSSESIYSDSSAGDSTPSIIEDRRFYVYVYFDPFTRDPFYVGKGTGKRAWDHLKEAYCKKIKKTRRHTKIKKIHRLGADPIIHIAYNNLTEVEAFQKEMSLIAHYGRLDNGTGCLTNLSDGGEGDVGRRFCIDKNLYTIYHQDGRVLKDITRMDVVDIFENHQTAAGFLSSGYSQGWYLDEDNPPEKLYVPDDKKFKMFNIKEKRCVYISKSECQMHGFTIDGFLELVRGKGKIRYGHCLEGDIEYATKQDVSMNTPHTMTNIVTGETRDITKHQFVRMFPHKKGIHGVYDKLVRGEISHGNFWVLGDHIPEDFDMVRHNPEYRVKMKNKYTGEVRLMSVKDMKEIAPNDKSGAVKAIRGKSTCKGWFKI